MPIGVSLFFVYPPNLLSKPLFSSHLNNYPYKGRNALRSEIKGIVDDLLKWIGMMQTKKMDETSKNDISSIRGFRTI